MTSEEPDDADLFTMPATGLLGEHWSVGLIALTAILLLAVVFGGTEASSTQVSSTGAGDPYAVTVAGDGTGSVTIHEDGSTREYTNVAFPATYSISDGTDVVAVEVHSTGTRTRCAIVDSSGTAVETSKNEGEHTISSCAARLG